MRVLFPMLCLAFLSGCAIQPASVSPAPNPRLSAAEKLIDAFYSFNPAPLRTALADAPSSANEILYYQGWAEGGNYKLLDRQPCRFEKADTVACSIKVKDDLIRALRTGYDVTDTFHMDFAGNRIVKVTTSSDDPPDMSAAFKWLRAKRPELWTNGPCQGFFSGGETPGNCIRAIVGGFIDYREAHPRPAG